MTQDFADVAQAVRELPMTLRERIVAAAWLAYPHARRIEFDAFGALHVDLPAIIDAVCVEVSA